MPALQILCACMRLSFFPSNVTSPRPMWTKPMMVFIIVDLPAPFAPMTETISPG